MTFSLASRRWVVAAVAALMFTAMSGCSGGDGGGASPADGPVSITLAETPGIPQYFAQFGVEKGFFEDEGLDLEVRTLPGGAQQATAAIAGEVQFTGGDVAAFNSFRTRDLPMMIVRPGTSAAATPEHDFSTVQSPADSSIETVADLAGATIAVNELNNIGTITVRGVLEKAGVNPDDVKFVELPFPDMLPALDAGSIDAAWVIEPFSTIGLQQKNRSIMAPYAEYSPGIQIGLVLCTTMYAEQNPDVVDAFQAAHERTGEYVNENPDEFKDFLVSAGGFDPAVVAKMNLPVYNARLDVAFVEQVGQDMVDMGLIDAVPDYGDFIDENA